jgi:hypothetical protein
MITQKAALIGCKEGPWISTSELRNQKLVVKGPAGVVVDVQQKHGEVESWWQADGPGIHEMPADGDWLKLRLRDGSSPSVLCFVLSGGYDESGVL